ncbi:MAG: glycosyl hydrolase [Acidobacteria bacterium]|nr:glycosyl hydrolase [Acidobacteriota bacterium]MBI3664288.1 glycosyl hydrolase [Acidobacteriota bacterium]
MKYRLVGPYRGGRSLSSAGVPGDPNTYYFGGTGSGAWKTANGGMTWTPLFDKQPVSSVGAIAVADSNPNVIYAGTGEACIRGNISHGDGVYKSTDGGKTWTHAGLKETRTISKIIIHPKNADIVYVAALGHVYGNNAERGVFRTMDGGKTWEKVLYKDEKTGAVDITFVPGNPSILFAALWEAGRTPWSMTSGGAGSGLYKSSDGGSNWKPIKGNGWPETTLGKIGVSVSGGDANRVYVILEALEELGGVYRSDDGGEHWVHTTDDHRLRHRPWYYTHVTADPKNTDTVYVLNTSLYRSTDGGKNFSPVGGIPHGDHHSLWIDPNNPKRMINSNDGGATISVDGGVTWSRQDNQPTAQFYHVAVDNQYPYNLYGSQQDNSNVRIRSRSDKNGIGRAEWDPVGGGEAGYVAPNPADPNIVYAGEYFGILTRYDERTKQVQNVSVWPDNLDGWEAAPLKYRFNWTQPIHVSKHDPKVVYYTGNHVFRSTTEGMSWEEISPDLTRNDKSKQGRSGGPITGENISIETYNVVFSFAESPIQKDLLWAGADDGLVHITRDGGKTWSNVSPKMYEGMVSQIDASPHDAAVAYIAVDRHKFDDLKPYIYKTADFGKTWMKITTGIPDSSFVRVVREDPKRKGLLYAGTETGIYASFDDGANWQALQLNLPTTPVHDLMVKDDDLCVATHGRAFWILDDLSPLRQMRDDVAKSDAHLFTPAPATRARTGGGYSRSTFQGDNPPAGAVFYYYLKAEQKDEITLEILDAQSKVIRKYSNKEKVVEGKPLPERPADDTKPNVLPAAAGLNRFVWNFYYEMPDLVPSAIYDMGPPHGPIALPGKYTVRLNVAGKSYTAAFEVKLDPRVKTSLAELQRQFNLMIQVRDLLGSAHSGVLEMRSVRAQLAAIRKRLARDAKNKPALDMIDAIEKKMAPVEAELIEVRARSSQDMCNYPTKLNSKIAWLDNVVDSADMPPTQQSFEFYSVMKTQADKHLAAWKEILAKDVAALNDWMKKENIPAISAGYDPTGASQDADDDSRKEP